MACELTKGRALDCKTSVGGIKAVYFAQLEDTTITHSAGTATDVDITTNLFKYALPRNTGNWVDTITGSVEAGTVFYEPTVNISLHGLSAADLNEIKLLAQNRLVIFVEMNNKLANGHNQIICCGYENGMEVTTGVAGQSGTGFGDMVGQTLTFVGAEQEPSLVVADYTTAPFDNTGFTVTVTAS